MAQVRIQVTEADIKKAETKSSMRCVVAQAIARTVPDARRVDVDVQTVRWTRGDDRYVYLTPYSVQGYIIAFDAGDDIQPFTFALDDRRRVPVKTTRKTVAGKTIGRAAQQKRRKKAKAAQLEAIVSGKADPPPTPTEKKIAKAKLPEARAAVAEAETVHEDVQAAYADSVHNERTGEGRPKAPARVHKTSERHYGHRVLRINQQ
jgi:hypothetical protein